MAAGRKPGPQGYYDNPIDVEDGTMCRAKSATQGALGTSSNPYPKDGCGDLAASVIARAAQLAPGALFRETGHAFGGGACGFIPDLLKELKDLIANIPRRAMLGDFADALTGARVVGRKGILKSLGLEFLRESTDITLGEMIGQLQTGISRVQNLHGHTGSECDLETEQAAEELARSVSIIVRVILQGAVSYLLSSGSTAAARGVVAPGQSIRADETGIIADSAVAELVKQLRFSNLDSSFATWVEQNWKDLVRNPRLQRRSRPSAGGASASADRASSDFKPLGAAVPEPRPPSPPSQLVESPSQPLAQNQPFAKKDWIQLLLMPLPYLKPLPEWWPKTPAKPYASEPFSAEITDGHKDSTLDRQGKVGYDGIPAGSCEFVFNNFYEEVKDQLKPKKQ